MTKLSGAVFLSYASQDSEAARRICEALRAVAIEVWFDQSELRGGDAWDHKIRRQIRDCAIFIPIISNHSEARTEGYFRFEWHLADQRTHLMARRRAFLLPVCIDATPEAEAEVPESFCAVQWTRLPDGRPSAAFVDLVRSLVLSDDPGGAPTRTPQIAATAPAEPVHEELPAARPSSARVNPVWLLIPAVLVIALACAIGVHYFPRLAARTAPAAAPVASVVSTGLSVIPDKSIAVLPFADLSEKKDQEYFSDGLSEELIDLLAKVQDLRVPARTSSFYFKGQHATIAEIAKALSVAQVLEGSVRKAGNTIRVTAQLVRADNGYHLWSETYDRDLKDVFKVQDEIAGAVVAALKLKLSPGSQPTSAHRTSNTEAYNQYLLGLRFDSGGRIDDFQRSIAAYRKATELDPSYAAAYAKLALAELYNDRDGESARAERALTAANKAVLLAPDQADGYVARGSVRCCVFSHDGSGAQQDFETALALNPGDAGVHHGYSFLLVSLGRLPQAIAAARKACELDPLSGGSRQSLGHLLLEDRQYPEAREALRRALEITPDSAYALADLATLQLLEGMPADALATFRQIRDAEELRLLGIAIAEHSLGHTEESQQALADLIANHAQIGADQIAEVYAWRGERDRAFEWLNRAYDQHDGGLSDAKYDPMLSSLHEDARFRAFLRKFNLPE